MKNVLCNHSRPDTSILVFQQKNGTRGQEMTAKENIIVRLLRWLGILKPVPISKGEMCEQAKSVCNKECANCAWNGGRYDR